MLVKILIISLFVLLKPLVLKADNCNWVHWRGPNTNGVVSSSKPPTHWSEKKNIRWKVPIDGAGASTPIIWKDKIFLLSVVDTGKVDPSLPRPEDQPKRVFDITLTRILSLSFLLFVSIVKMVKSYGGGWLPK